MDIGGTTINLILHNITVSKITLIKDRRRSSRRLQPQAYTQAPRQTTPASDPIIGVISQLMEQMTRMNSRVDEIQDFVKTNVQPTTDK